MEKEVLNEEMAKFVLTEIAEKGVEDFFRDLFKDEEMPNEVKELIETMKK